MMVNACNGDVCRDLSFFWNCEDQETFARVTRCIMTDIIETIMRIGEVAK